MTVQSVPQPSTLVAEGLVRVRDAAAYLGVSRATVYVLMDRGSIPWVKIGRSRRIPRRALTDLAAASLRGGRP